MQKITLSLIAIATVAALASITFAAQDAAAADVRIWNLNLVTLENKLTPPEEGTPLEPISIVAARNGWFSGKIMARGKAPLDGLTATVTQLTSESGQVIPTDRIQVRYGVEWHSMTGQFYKPGGLDKLLELPPTGVTETAIWVTVNTPADVAPGLYKGTLRVLPAGAESVDIPVHLKVVQWVLPDTQNWQTWIELVQTTDTTALEYNVPLWSEEHWNHIARTFGYINRIGSRVVSLSIICHTNYGNAESLIRWIPQEDGSWKHDFSRFDRYLDTAIKQMGQPKLVVINAWDIYLNPPEGDIVPAEELPEDVRNHRYQMAVKRMQDARRALRGKGPAVTVELDAKAGEIDTLYLPPYEDEQSEALWQPVWDGIRERLKQRGLLDVTMVGMLTDSWPSKEQTEFLHKVSGGMKWVSNAHWSAVKRRGGKVFGIAEVGYETTVWDVTVTVNPQVNRTYGWQRNEHVGAHYRMSTINRMSPTVFRTQLEVEITGNQRGWGRIGGDFWWALRDATGKRRGTVTSRYLQSQWRNLDISSCILAPGSEGTVATARYEYLREGAQDCEARIFIEQALLNEQARAKVGDDLAARAQAFLDLRQKALWQARGVSEEQMAELGTVSNPGRTIKTNDGTGQSWYVQSNWQARSEQLFDLAAEVAAKLAAN